ncbi:MAG TPA: Asp-tRNA(Asn)/Glu-tRNA(Gln) amidotransferase subunit GatB [Thermomicrobiales bacterium]|nr:Asp-tRNA(Asn)/Glu-tRNA(Gln) amidotransferase subunit GatB [Thermomicrobiales bacterium]
MGSEFETVIGLEVHAQLLTRSKMFCGCSAEYFAAPPNTHVCPVCLGMPGVLPIVNRAAVEAAVMTGLAFGCEVLPANKFDRKNYFYPDLPKGYQISQYDLPLAVRGTITFTFDGEERQVGITRVHMEEDTGRNLHATDPVTGEGFSLVDLNRAGVPLLEIVGEPDLRSPEEARAYMMKLRQILRYIGVSTGNMEEGALRCDANVSLRPVGATTFGAKVEIKNMNSFRAVERALAYEVERQRAILEAGGTIPQETRGWSEEQGATLSQRTKEEANDYRYFPEPDLPPLTMDPAWVETIRARMAELPDARLIRFRLQYGLRPDDAVTLTDARPVADYFEAVLAGDQAPDRAQKAANWIVNDLFATLSDREAIGASPVTPARLRGLLDLLDAGAINQTAAKQVLAAMLNGAAPAEDAAAIVARLGLAQVRDEAPIRDAVRQAIAANPQPVADFLSGKTAAKGRLVGATMKLLGGRGDIKVVNRLLDEELQAQANAQG